MYSQKQLITNAIKHMKPIARKYFIYAWLEDINWHSENTKFCEKHMFLSDKIKIDGMEMLAVALDPHAYSKGFVDEKANELIEYSKAWNHAGSYEHAMVHMPNGEHISKETFRDFRNAQNFAKALSYMTGWGMDGDSWESTSGDGFLKEIDGIFAGFAKADEEAEKVAESYRRLND